MPDTFHLEIVTPEKMIVRDEAEEMQIPGKSGYLGILPGPRPSDYRTLFRGTQLPQWRPDASLCSRMGIRGGSS